MQSNSMEVFPHLVVVGLVKSLVSDVCSILIVAELIYTECVCFWRGGYFKSHPARFTDKCPVKTCSMNQNNDSWMQYKTVVKGFCMEYWTSVLKDCTSCRYFRELQPCPEANKASLLTPLYSSTVVRMQVWFRAYKLVPTFYFCGFNPGEEHFLYNTPLLSSLKIAEMDVCLIMNIIYMLGFNILLIPVSWTCLHMCSFRSPLPTIIPIHIVYNDALVTLNQEWIMKR